MAEEYKFKVDNEEFEFLPETFETKEAVQLAYSQAYGHYLKEGIMTKAQAIELGRKNGVTDEDWEQRISTLLLNIMTNTAKLHEEQQKKRPNKTRIEELKKLLRDTRREYEKANSIQNDLVQATCENLAENRAIEYSVVLRLVDSNGNHVFRDHPDLINRYDEKIAFEAVQRMLYLTYGLPYQLEGLYPEDTPEPAEEPSKPAKKTQRKKATSKK